MPAFTHTHKTSLTRAIAVMPWGAENAAEPPVRVEFKGERRHNAIIQITSVAPKEKRSAAESLADILPREAVDALLKQETKLISWMKKSPANATQMILDPMAALKNAGIKLDADAFSRLVQHREAARRTLNLTSLSNLESLTIEVGARGAGLAPAAKKTAKNQ